jgi:phosphoglycolate phosphatase-like HAD superfamily hydrolase
VPELPVPPPRVDDRPTLAVFDVDGVLADVRHRLHHVESRPKDWPAFFAAMSDDPPLPVGIALVHDQLAAGHAVAYLTGRNESYRAVTQEWMREHGLPEGRLVMRREADRRPARQFKPEALRRLQQSYRVVAMVDDDAVVVEALRREGWPVLHATWMTEHSSPVQQASLFEAQELDGRS